MYCTYLATFEFNEKQQGSQRFEKLENLMVVYNYINCTFHNEKSSFVNEIPNFLTNRFSLKLPTTCWSQNFSIDGFDMNVGQLDSYTSLHAL
jgi:hypothetical protein